MSMDSVGPAAALQFVQSVFSKVDSDTSGGISPDEMQAATSSAGVDSSIAQNVFAQADADGSGEVSTSELQSVFVSMAPETRSGLLEAQEQGGDTMAVGQALAQYAGVASEGASPDGASPSSSEAQGGGGAGAGGASGGSTVSTDAADANGDGKVTAAEQAKYDATHPSASQSSSSSSTTSAALDLAA